MRRVAIVAVAQSVHSPRRDDATPAELVYPVVRDAVAACGFERHEIAYTTAGSADVLEGRPFSFGFALDVAGAVPPIEESHIEGDGAWAAYDAWIRIQSGDVDSAIVIAWGKSSEGSLAHVMNATLDPFYESPLGLDDVAIAALQARACGFDDATLRAVVERARAGGARNPFVSTAFERPPLDSPFVVEPLRRSYLPPVTDGACALVMTITPRTEPLAWIAGVAHATDAASIGARVVTDASSARVAFERAWSMAGFTSVDIAELHTRFPHHELMLRDIFSLNGSTVNASGGPLAADPIMATGLVRLGDAATQAGARGVRALAHATAGHALQSNIVWMLEP
ncbi:MAG: lipid-transfer protein [Actinomycetota bacterium]